MARLVPNTGNADNHPLMLTSLPRRSRISIVRGRNLQIHAQPRIYSSFGPPTRVTQSNVTQGEPSFSSTLRRLNYSDTGHVAPWSNNPMAPASVLNHPSTSSSPSSSSPSDARLEREAEVDALTNILMQNISGGGQDRPSAASDDSSLVAAAASTDFYGLCAKCNGGVMGHKSGVSVLGRVFHNQCFVCKECSNQLVGRPSFSLDGWPSCENCFLKSLEQCSVCSKPITDRILRATGRPYHPQCFLCVVCHTPMDGVAFTVDALNQIHCIADFHKKYAPRCSRCHQPIMPENGSEEAVRIIALDRSFHVNCYTCEDCHINLTEHTDGCFPLDDHIYCRPCNTKRIHILSANLH